MKHLVFTLWFVLFLSSTGLAGVEYVTEEVCPALAGCWMNVKTGECPDCVMERREVAHTHEEKPVIVEKSIFRSISKKEKLVDGYTRKVKWTCVVEPCDFIDSNGNLIDES